MPISSNTCVHSLWLRGASHLERTEWTGTARRSFLSCRANLWIKWRDSRQPSGGRLQGRKTIDTKTGCTYLETWLITNTNSRLFDVYALHVGGGETGVVLHVYTEWVAFLFKLRKKTKKRPRLSELYHNRGDMLYLNMKMKSRSKAKKTATLSIVRNMTINWRRKFGMKRTNFKMRKRRNVLKTERPELPPSSPSKRFKLWNTSTKLSKEKTMCNVEWNTRG